MGALSLPIIPLEITQGIGTSKEVIRQNTLLFALAAIVFTFQLFTLSIPSMNGDEAIYSLVIDEARKLFSGMGFSLNPVIDYSGPLDFWISGSVYGLASLIPSIPAGVWMVRIVPLVLFWLAAIALYRETRHHAEAAAPWVLFTAAIAPMALVYSRIGFPHGLLLATFFLLFAESLRISRTGEVRWFRIAFLAGLAVETNSTAFLGLAVVFAPTLLVLVSRARHSPIRALAAVLLFALLAYPVVRNFPPPVVSVPGKSMILEIRNALNVISGQQPFVFLLTEEVAPAALQIAFLVFFLGLVGFEIRTLLRRRGTYDRNLLLHSAFHFAGALFLLIMCYRGRTLTMIGQERYFIVLVPGAVLLTADAISRLKWRPRWVALGLFAFFFVRLASPLVRFAGSEDPSLLAARWLEKECPRESCVAVAENFWNYWPVRYYTRGSIDLNSGPENWKAVANHPLQGRKLAGCWYTDSGRPYLGSFERKIVFSAQPGRLGQICYFGMEAGLIVRDIGS